MNSRLLSCTTSPNSWSGLPELFPTRIRATGAGMRSVEHIKRYTSISTANDQGKTSAVNAIGLIAAALNNGATPGQVGTTTYRAPYAPVAFAALAGRDRGDLFDPARFTSIHHWHVAQGAEFEIVGQWLRPWYYPKDGESMDDAVRRECAAARASVGMMDATTLGKIEVRGTDAGEFLNRIYTNAFKKLAQDLSGKKLTTEKKVTTWLAKNAGIDTIETVLLYHVVPGATIASKDAVNADGAQLTTAQGGTITVDVIVKWLGLVKLVDQDPTDANPYLNPFALDINKGNKQIAHGITAVLRPVDLP